MVAVELLSVVVGKSFVAVAVVENSFAVGAVDNSEVAVELAEPLGQDEQGPVDKFAGED